MHSRNAVLAKVGFERRQRMSAIGGLGLTVPLANEKPRVRAGGHR